jgi:hypothetical protein
MSVMCPVPPLSVVMPARNVAPYVDAAVESILRQSFTDFELVIRDDGSTDGTRERLRIWAGRDPRIRLFEGEQTGLAGSSNWIVQRARAPLVARMDGDDIARPDRLERQLAVLRRDHEVLMVGSLSDSIDASGDRIRAMDRWRIVRRSWFAPFQHTSVMFRRDAFDTIGGYHPLSYCEDWDFFLRMANEGRIAVIADALVSHRIIATSASGAPEHRHVVQDAIDRMLDALPAKGSGGSYKPVTPTSAAETGRPVNPLAIVSSNSTLLWSGGAPRVFGEVLRRGRLRLDMATLGALGWALLAQISPALLRLVLRTMLHARNVAARFSVHRGRVYQWQPGPRRGLIRIGEDASPLNAAQVESVTT